MRLNVSPYNVPLTPTTVSFEICSAEAFQLSNFLRDVGRNRFQYSSFPSRLFPHARKRFQNQKKPNRQKFRLRERALFRSLRNVSTSSALRVAPQAHRSFNLCTPQRLDSVSAAGCDANRCRCTSARSSQVSSTLRVRPRSSSCRRRRRVAAEIATAVGCPAAQSRRTPRVEDTFRRETAIRFNAPFQRSTSGTPVPDFPDDDLKTAEKISSDTSLVDRDSL